MSNEIFTKEALEKLRSPDKLDTMFKITTPISWMALLALAMAVFSVVLWSIFGAFTEKAEGVGMIMDAGGVAVISPVNGGKIDQIYVKTGDKVKKGTLIAKLAQDAQNADTHMARYDVNLSSSDREAMQRVAQYDTKRYQQRVSEEIYSTREGIVTEVSAHEGSIVGAGTAICSLRVHEERSDLSGVFYVPVEKGKRLKPGMTIQLAPNGVDTSQTGSLVGIVRTIGEYPVTMESMRTTLGNDQLAQWFLQRLASSVVEVQFDLVRDENSESGYLWTSVVGEHKIVSSGSFCTGTVIIDRKPPIEKVFYKISQFLRSR